MSVGVQVGFWLENAKILEDVAFCENVEILLKC